MTYASAQADHTRAVKFLWDHRNVLIGAFLTNTDAIKDELDGFDSVTASRMLAVLRANRDTQARFRDVAQQVLDVAHVRIAEEIGSPQLVGGAIADPEEFFRDWRNFQAGVTSGSDVGEAVPGRAVTYAADPAAADGVRYLRTTVDERGQKIESGIHNETVKARVVNTVGSGAGGGGVVSELIGEDGGVDALDYRRGSGRQGVTVTQINPDNPGLARNPALLVTGIAIADAAAITGANIGQWDFSAQSGAPTLEVKLNTWLNKTYGVRMVGNATTGRLTQPMVLANVGQYQAPLPFVVVHYDGTWTGTITLRYGGATHAVTNAAFSGAGIYVIAAPRDSLLYPINYTEPVPALAVDVANTNTGVLIIHQIDIAEGVEYQNVRYYSLPHTAFPVLGIEKTWGDSVNFAGKRQDMLAWAYEEAPFAYLNTVGDIAWADPS